MSMTHLSNIRKATWSGIKSGVILCGILLSLSLVIVTFAFVGLCINMVVQFNDYNSCNWVPITIFVIFMSLLVIVIWYSARQLTKFDLILSVTTTGLVISILFIETLTWLNEYGAMLPVFATILGFLGAGRVRKISWKPRTQFLVLMLIIIAGGWLYVLGPNYIGALQWINSTESLPSPLLVIFRVVIELAIIIAMMYLSEDARKWLHAKIHSWDHK